MCVENIIYIYIWYVDCILLYTVWYEYALHFVIVQWFVAHTITCIHPAIFPSVHPSVHPSIHPPALTLQSTTLQSTTLLHVTLHYITLHCVTLHCVAVLSQFYHIILHYIPWHCVACYMALPTHTQIVYICTYIYIYTYNNVEIEQLFPSAAGGWTLPGPDGGRLGESGACQGQLAQIEWHWKNTQLLIHLSLETTALRLVQSYDLRLLTSLLSDSVIERSEAHIYIYTYIRII